MKNQKNSYSFGKFAANNDLTKLFCSPEPRTNIEQCKCVQDKIEDVLTQKNRADITYKELVEFPGFLDYTKSTCNVSFGLLGVESNDNISDL